MAAAALLVGLGSNTGVVVAADGVGVKSVSTMSEVNAPTEIKGYDWYTSQPPANFTLQLVVSAERDIAEQFALDMSVPAPRGIFMMMREGERLYVLTQGSYQSRDEAERVAKGLAIGQIPWVRSVESIQQVMERSSKSSVIAPSVAPSPLIEGGVKDTAWVWSQDPNRYTVQLVASSDESALQASMQQMAFQRELAVVQTASGRPTLFVLIYGSFDSREEAQSAIEQLPEELKRSGPWVRHFFSLQDEMSLTTTP